MPPECNADLFGFAPVAGRAARPVRLHQRLLQSSADLLSHRLYHPRTGRGKIRIIRCPLFRGKVSDVLRGTPVCGSVGVDLAKETLEHQ
jgi:hypothetical protein